MQITDKYYKLRQETVREYESRILNAVSVPEEKHHLCMEDINALARMLVYGLKTGNTASYETAVDYLWMSVHIEENHRHCLLDLLED